MERGFSHETFPGFDPEREISRGEREPTPEDKEAEMERELMEAFETGKRFDDEDEKARDYNARLDAADELSNEIDEISESISQASGQLASLPLTGDQAILLQQIEALIAELQKSTDPRNNERLDQQITALTRQFAALPTTPEQATLLDDILGLIDERNALQVKLQGVFRNN